MEPWMNRESAENLFKIFQPKEFLIGPIEVTEQLGKAIISKEIADGIQQLDSWTVREDWTGDK